MQIPYFNAPIFLENKTQVGKVDEILGQINCVVSGGGRVAVVACCEQPQAQLWRSGSDVGQLLWRPLLQRAGHTAAATCGGDCSPAAICLHVLPVNHLPLPLSIVLQYFTVKMSDGVVATSYSKGDKFFIDPQASSWCWCCTLLTL